MRYWIAIILPPAFLLPACGERAGDDPSPAATVKASLECPAQGERLAITGLCAERAASFLDVTGGEAPKAPQGCEWSVQETRFDDAVLLYRATQCGDKTTRLAFSDGPPMAELSYDTAAYGDPENALKGEVLVRVAGLDASDRTATILRIARDAIDDPRESKACTVRNARIDYWPADALVVDVGAAQAAQAPPDEPRASCGPFGLSEDESAFWRVFHGHSWFFQLGQDVWQIDPGSFTLLAKDRSGTWVPVE